MNDTNIPSSIPAGVGQRAQIVPLGELAHVHAGFLLRQRLENDPEGNVRVLQIRDMQDDLSINYDKAYRVRFEQAPEKHLVSEGDILFKARSYRTYEALLIDRPLTSTIASSHFFIVRPNDKKVLPEFVQWYMNQAEAQTYFKQWAKGTNLPAVSLQPLVHLQIPVPPIALQKTLIEQSRLVSKHRELTEKLQKDLEFLTWKVSLKALQGNLKRTKENV